jgi:ribosome biogenesis GTPase
VSAETCEGLPALRAAFGGHISAVVGPSGVGKSTLLNAVCPGLALRTGEVSEVDGRGRHTTTAAELVRLPGADDGFVIDTPGLRAFGLWDLAPDELLVGFPDIEEAAAGCRFTNCRHGDEPGCAVRAAVDEGALDPERHASYLRLREEVEAEAAQRQAARRR